MSAAEVFARIDQHMIEGIMIHSDFVDYYTFLNLPGYAACHCWHSMCEAKSRQKVHDYYLTHHGRLIPYVNPQNRETIPANWYGYTRADVDQGTLRNAVKSGLEAWVKWETDTKHLYETAYRDLLSMNEVASAEFVRELILDVSEELATAERYHLNKKAVDYDIGAILADQDKDTKLFKARLAGI